MNISKTSQTGVAAPDDLSGVNAPGKIAACDDAFSVLIQALTGREGSPGDGEVMDADAEAVASGEAGADVSRAMSPVLMDAAAFVAYMPRTMSQADPAAAMQAHGVSHPNKPLRTMALDEAIIATDPVPDPIIDVGQRVPDAGRIEIVSAKTVTHRAPPSVVVLRTDAKGLSEVKRDAASPAVRHIQAEEGIVSPIGNSDPTAASVAPDRPDGRLIDIAGGASPGQASVAGQIASAVEAATLETLGEHVDAAQGEERAFWQAARLHVLDVVLKPEHLGRIEIRLKLDGGSLSVRLTPQLQAARQVLEQELDGLKDRLRAAGYDLASISIQNATPVVLGIDSTRETGAASSGPDGRSTPTGDAQGNQRNEEHQAKDRRRRSGAAQSIQGTEDTLQEMKAGVYV